MVLSGDFIGTVTDISLEVVGKDKLYPVLNIFFNVDKGFRGGAITPVPNVKCKKMFFLTTEPVKTGKNAGKSQLEVIKENLKQAFDYSGGLREDALKAGLTGKEARIVCEAKSTPRGEVTEVKWVNNVDGKGAFERRPIPADLLRALDKTFGGDTASPVADPWDTLGAKA